MLTALAAIVMLGLLIFVHELGHFLAFKLTGVKVLKFSLGFDPVLFKRQIGETSYQLGCIPIGGYVRPLGEDDGDEIAPEDRGRALGDKPLWKRALAFFAGPAMNLVFPVLIYWLVYAVPGDELSPRIGMTVQGMPAEAAGVMPGDRIIKVAGVETPYWAHLQEEISSRPGKTFPIEIERRGQRVTVQVTAEAVKETNRLGEAWTEGRIGVSPQSLEARVVGTDAGAPAAAAGLESWDLVRAVNGKKVGDWIQFRDAFEAAGAGPVALTVARRDEGAVRADAKGRRDRSGVKEKELTVTVQSTGVLARAGVDNASLYVRDIEPGGPAETAGVKPGDRVVSVDGRRLGYWGSLEETFRREPSKTFEVELTRGDQTFTARVVLAKRTEKDEFKQENVYYSFGAWSDAGYTPGEYVHRSFQPVRGLREALKTTGEIIRVTYVAVYQLVTGKLSVKTVGGPIMIFDMAGKVAKKGVASYFWFMGLISINLGIFNLLPIPILDGGHLLLAAIEAAMRRPLSHRIRLAVSYVGMAVLASLFVLVFKNDIERYWDSITGLFR